jgi:hypothetical protein
MPVSLDLSPRVLAASDVARAPDFASMGAAGETAGTSGTRAGPASGSASVTDLGIADLLFALVATVAVVTIVLAAPLTSGASLDGQLRAALIVITGSLAAYVGYALLGAASASIPWVGPHGGAGLAAAAGGAMGAAAAWIADRRERRRAA